jgi:hypothetical protein
MLARGSIAGAAVVGAVGTSPLVAPVDVAVVVGRPPLRRLVSEPVTPLTEDAVAVPLPLLVATLVVAVVVALLLATFSSFSSSSSSEEGRGGWTTTPG